MKTEYEVKILEPDFSAVREKLKQLGAKQMQPRRMMKRWILDFADNRMQTENGYIRVRDEGDRVTTTFKKTVNKNSIEGVKEIETEVADAQALIDIYAEAGLVASSYQETYRESWQLGDIEIELDEWPWLEPYIEIEAHDEQSVKDLTQKLGYSWDEVLFGDVIQLYQRIFDVEDWEMARFPKVVFGPVPSELEVKRR